MSLPKTADIKLITFSVYGTLIDWETGVYEAFKKEADRDGIEVKREQIIPMFHEIRREIETKSYELYAEVLRRTVHEMAKRMAWDFDSSRSNFLPQSVAYWKPFKEVPSLLKKFSKQYSLGFISNIDDKMLGETRRHLPVDLDIVVTSQQVRAYKPEVAHFKECQRRVGSKKGWVHIAESYHYDVAACSKARIPMIWVNRSGEEPEGKRKPTAEVKNLKEAAKLLGL